MIKSYLSLRLVEKGWKMKDLADKTGINFHTISDIYHARRYPTEGTLQKLSNVLGVQGSDIIEILPDAPEGQNNKGSAEKGKDVSR